MMIPELKSIKIGQPAQRALEVIGITTLIQLCDYTEKELLAIHGVGPKSVRIIKESLLNEGFSFKE